MRLATGHPPCLALCPCGCCGGCCIPGTAAGSPAFAWLSAGSINPHASACRWTCCRSLPGCRSRSPLCATGTRPSCSCAARCVQPGAGYRGSPAVRGQLVCAVHPRLCPSLFQHCSVCYCCTFRSPRMFSSPCSVWCTRASCSRPPSLRRWPAGQTPGCAGKRERGWA